MYKEQHINTHCMLKGPLLCTWTAANTSLTTIPADQHQRNPHSTSDGSHSKVPVPLTQALLFHCIPCALHVRNCCCQQAPLGIVVHTCHTQPHVARMRGGGGHSTQHTAHSTVTTQSRACTQHCLHTGVWLQVTGHIEIKPEKCKGVSRPQRAGDTRMLCKLACPNTATATT